MPALMCTAVPPAKSIALSLLAIQPPVSAVTPSKANTQCATGKYTNVAHRPANTSQPPNFSRSATAPEISATVMMANINWNATNTVCGIVPATGWAPPRLQFPRPDRRLPRRRVPADETLEAEVLAGVAEQAVLVVAEGHE